MYQEPGYGYAGAPRRPHGPPPNYAARRLVALLGVLIVLLIVFSAFGRVFGGGSDSSSPSTTAATSSTTRVQEPNPCNSEPDQSLFARPEDWARTIVDAQYALPILYEPSDLVSATAANYSAEFQIREFMATNLNLMRNALLRENLPEVALLAAYRSIDTQAQLFAGRVAELGEEIAATTTAAPGHSEHHLGTAIDVRLIGERAVDETFGATPTGEWLAENSWRYGFVLSYPKGKEAVTCNAYEPYHFRYIGIDLGAKVWASGLTLREYLWHWEVTGFEPIGPGRAGVLPTPLVDSTTSSTAAASEDAAES